MAQLGVGRGDVTGRAAKCMFRPGDRQSAYVVLDASGLCQIGYFKSGD